MEKEFDLLDISRERVYIETSEYIIRGYIYIPKATREKRIISEILNSSKKFIAVKDCLIENKSFNSRKNIEEVDFMQVSVASILIVKPIPEN